MNAVDWGTFLEKAGVPFSILLVFGYFVLMGVRWLGVLLMNLQTRHIAFLDKTESALQSTKDSQDKIMRALATLTKEQAFLQEAVVQIYEIIKDLEIVDEDEEEDN